METPTRERASKPSTYLAMGLVLVVLGAVQAYTAYTQPGAEGAHVSWMTAGACAVIAPFLLWRYFRSRRKQNNAR